MKEAIDYWLKSSQDDLDTAQKLFQLKNFITAFSSFILL